MSVGSFALLLCEQESNQHILSTHEYTSAPGQLDVLGYDGHMLGMYGGQIGVLKRDQVGLSSLLECQDSRGLETQVRL